MEILPFLDSLGCVENAPIVTAAVTYDDPKTGQPVLLVIHQAIYVAGLKHNLLSPMQLRHSGIIVNERPKHCTPVPEREDHAIVIPDGKYMITLDLYGITSYFPTRTPTDQEASWYHETGDFMELTESSPEWDPNSTHFQELEKRFVDRYGELLDQVPSHPRQLFALSTDDHYVQPFRKIGATRRKRPGPMDVETLAKNWAVGIESADRTLRATTQRGVRSFEGNEVGVEKRFPTGDRHLRYRRLNHPLYHDTLFSSIKSTRGNKCSQVYATDFAWSRNFPMKKKGGAHHTLDDLFHRYGVPTKLISDDAKELVQGELARKA